MSISDFEFPAPPSSPSLLERLRAVCEVLLAGLGGTIGAQALWLLSGSDPALILSSARDLAGFLVLDGTLTLVVVYLLLRSRQESWSAIGLGRRPFPREAALGLLVLPALIAGVVMVGLFFQQFLPHLVTTENPILELIQTPTDVLLFLVSSVYVGGIKEEIQRAFALTRFEDYLGGAVPGLIIWSTLFGLGHVTQGVDNACKAAILGLGFGVLYIWRRDPASAIISHAAWDVVTVILIWFFVRGG